MNQKELIKYFKNKNIPYSIIAKSIGVTTKTVYNWFEKEKLKHTSYIKLLEYYKKLNANAERSLTMDQQNMLIEYQKKEIQSLKEQIINTPELTYDSHADIIFKFNVKIRWSLKNPSVSVMYNDTIGAYVPKMAKKLGYSEAEMVEFLQIGEMVRYSQHNIHKLRTKQQRDEMISTLMKFMHAYDKVKMNMTSLIAEIPVIYTHKNGTPFLANVEYRVNWLKGTGTAHIRWCKD